MIKDKALEKKQFFVLFFAGVFATIAVLPYVADTIAKTELPLPLSTILILSVIQTSFLFLLVVFLGQKLTKKVGLDLPLLRNYLANKKLPPEWQGLIKIGIVTGLVTGIIIIAGDYIFFTLGSPISLFATDLPAWWKGLLAAFYGGIGEELILRFFLMSLLVWVIAKLFKKENQPNSLTYWTAIIITAVIFGLLHLPVTAMHFPLTGLVVLRAILLNGIGGLVFGYLFWKYGLESAIISHFTTDIVIHVFLQIAIS